jgi:uncharacterized protein YegL
MAQPVKRQCKSISQAIVDTKILANRPGTKCARQETQPPAWHSQRNKSTNKKTMKLMNTIPQISAAEIGLAQNPEPRCPCLILTDVSGSMAGKPIAEVNAGQQRLKAKLVEDALACLRVELALVTFNENVTVAIDFCSPDNFNPPTLTASGGTHLGAAILKGLEMLNARTAEYRAAGISYYRPWLMLLTDAESGDDIAEAAQLVKEAESNRRLAFFGIGVLGANMNALGSLSLRPPLCLEGIKFQELFEWLSVNLSSVAVSRPGDQVPLTAPTWATV